MIVVCPTCGVTYEDAQCWTFCPHEAFLSQDKAAQKDAALALLGKRVRFHHEPTPRLVIGVTFDGMVEIEGFGGYFAPSLFELVPGQNQAEAHS